MAGLTIPLETTTSWSRRQKTKVRMEVGMQLVEAMVWWSWPWKAVEG
uniref:Uncharacterized protein n=1 Tax=Arundo donax TaxID=35708 RepID=A0A0A9A2I1_ARUDO